MHSFLAFWRAQSSGGVQELCEGLSQAKIQVRGKCSERARKGPRCEQPGMTRAGGKVAAGAKGAGEAHPIPPAAQSSALTGRRPWSASPSPIEKAENPSRWAIVIGVSPLVNLV